MLTALLIAILFTVGAAAAMHNSVDEKMHAKPWRFLVPAITAIVVAFLFQTSVESLSNLLAQLDSSKDHLADLRIATNLVNLVVGAFAGGMIGAAVSLRAQILNEKKRKGLLASLAEISLSLEEAKKHLANIENDSTLSGAEKLEKADKARKLVLLHLMDWIETEREVVHTSP